MDWDKLRIFHAAAEAGSFTHAGDVLNMSQSAVSRQVSALERDLTVTLFHRHARGLVMTEQGELLFRTAHDVFNRLKTTRALLADSKDKPSGNLRVTTPVGLGSSWLTSRLGEFMRIYPDIMVDLMLTDEQVDIAMREADCGIWLSEPQQKELIRRPLFTVHLHAYAATSYIRQFGSPAGLDALEGHRLLSFGGAPHLPTNEMNWLTDTVRNRGVDAAPVLRVDNVYGLREAARAGLGIAVLPDYLVGEDDQLVVVLENTDLPELQSYFVYSEEMRHSKRLNVFRDFIIAQARVWKF